MQADGIEQTQPQHQENPQLQPLTLGKQTNSDNKIIVLDSWICLILALSLFTSSAARIASCRRRTIPWQTTSKSAIPNDSDPDGLSISGEGAEGKCCARISYTTDQYLALKQHL